MNAVKEYSRRVSQEYADIFEYELELQRRGILQRLTVVRARIEMAYEELEGIMTELMEDPLYEELCAGMLEENTKTINRLRSLEERLNEELELLSCHASSLELSRSMGVL